MWELYRRAWARTGPTATLYEWDEDVPAFEVVHAEARKALAHRGASAVASRRPEGQGPRLLRDQDTRPGAGAMRNSAPALDLPLERLQAWMQTVIVHAGPAAEAVRSPAAVAAVPPARLAEVILPSATLRPEERLAIYHGMYPLRMRDALAGDYPGSSTSWAKKDSSASSSTTYKRTPPAATP